VKKWINFRVYFAKFSLCSMNNIPYFVLSHFSLGWSDVSAYLSVLNLPDPVQFPMETWEWTIGRDYRDRIAGI